MHIKIGCCGFATAQEKYFKLFSTVEIQKTFYQPPLSETALKWREKAPSDFEFTLKAWQLITHDPQSPTYRRLKIKIKEKKYYGSFKNTDEVLFAWHKTEEIASILKAKVIVFQTPASFGPAKENIKNIERFFSSIDRKNYKFVWEPRGKWQAKDILDICQEFNLIHGVDPFKNKNLYGEMAYFRLHGIGSYGYHYTQSDFRRLNEICQSQAKDRKEIFLFFNNIDMLKDALDFKKLMAFL
jgi:uncharacterized protein YecE (DUF72 family)